MKNNGTFIKGKDDFPIYLYTWNRVNEPKGVVQIFHGMAEHAARYNDFAKHLNREGYIVYASDHRGHGKTAKGVDNLGNIGEDGFSNIVHDGYIINRMIKKSYSNLPIILLGHSFGSFISQEYIIKYGESIDGLILSGSAKMEGIPIKLGQIISTIQKKIYDDKNKANLIDKASFGNFNKKIKHPISKFSWLTRDEEQVEKYDEDPLCGTIFPIIYYYYFFDGLSKLYIKERLENIPKNLPIFIFSGDKDPVGGYGKQVKKLYETYKDIGIKNVNIKLYPGGRHEMLNEINRKEVYNHITDWIKEVYE
ncbi:alpha/beta hydrolase [Senegalia massiliensis]|uniref:Alpha/beta fold hydrolase n=1 Tax=Senegalia massiliensis TaxID=1720316 RepID=A0A845QXI2_9CLOT|nr:alpha/beta hydrolase [Senegalia massiliensis]NBI06981.1 alpha/beta fold hydrolase [Senegalia massiliensis]